MNDGLQDDGLCLEGAHRRIDPGPAPTEAVTSAHPASRRSGRSVVPTLAVALAATLALGACDPASPARSGDAPGAAGSSQATSGPGGGPTGTPSLPPAKGRVSAQDLFTADDVTDQCQAWIGEADATAASVGLQGSKFGWGGRRKTGTGEPSTLRCGLITADQGTDFDTDGAVTFRLVQGADTGSDATGAGSAGTGAGSAATGAAGAADPTPGSDKPLDATAVTKGDVSVQVDGSSGHPLADGQRRALAQQLADRLG